MGGIFGDSGAEAEAEKQRKQARRDKQDANEETAREQQRGERGSGTRGRDMLIGNLSKRLSDTLGG